MATLEIDTIAKRAVIDITDRVQQHVPSGNGIVHVMVAHTTAGLTTADLDPGTDQDLLDFLNSLVPPIMWRHPHDPRHAPAHLLASLIGPQVTVPYENGSLLLGTWQRIVLIEFDGPRQRQIYVQAMS